MNTELTTQILPNNVFAEEEEILQKAKFSFENLERYIDNSNVTFPLTDFIDTIIKGLNKFSSIIEEARDNEEKINSIFYLNIFNYPLCLKKKYKDNRNINTQINYINSKKEIIKIKLVNFRDKYLKENNKDTINICSKLTWNVVLFLIVSIFHYVAMSEIEGILYSISFEIKKIIIFMIKGEYTTDKTYKTFYEILKNSTLNDTAQINFNYFFSFLCPYFIKNNRVVKIYIFSIIIIFISFLLSSTANFEQNVENGSGTLTLLIIIYLIIYFFASLISLIPHKILMKNENYSCLYLLLINMSLTFGVIFKNIIHYIFEISSISYCSIIFLCFSSFFIIVCFFIGFCKKKYYNNSNGNNNIGYNYNNNIFNNHLIGQNHSFENNYNNNYIYNDNYNNELNISNDNNEIENHNLNTNQYNNINFPNNNHTNEIEEVLEHCFDLISSRKKFYTSDYYFGYLTIIFKDFKILIKIQSFVDFLLSLFNWKLIFIIFINLFSRAQKLKFKEEYKKEFDGYIRFHILNFFLSFCIAYLFIILVWYYHRTEKGIKLCTKDKWIMIFIGCESILMIIFSIINYFFSLRGISFCAITISGNINYLFYEYYSTQKVEYTSLSGIISIGQVVFRGLELLIPFKKNYGYFIQTVFSLAAAALCGIYVKKELEKNNIYYEKIYLLNN